MFSEIPRRLNVGARGLLRPALFAVLILADFPLSAEPSAEPIRAIRVWPAQDYTRVTVESGQPLKHNLLRVRDPERLVLDIYPVEPLDPILTLLQKRELKTAPGIFGDGTPEEQKPQGGPGIKQPPAGPPVDRLVTIAVDAGHGGEDPGARGRRGTR